MKQMMKIHRSKSLNTEVQNRINADRRLRAHFDEAAEVTFKGANIEDVIIGINLLNGLVEGPDMTIVSLQEHKIGIFKGTPDEVSARLQEIQLPPKRPVPEKVAVKMVVSRIKKLNDEHDKCYALYCPRGRHDEWLLRLPERPDPGSATYRSDVTRYLDDILVIQNQWAVRQIKKAVENFQDIIGRDDISDTAIARAMAVSSVEKIMQD